MSKLGIEFPFLRQSGGGSGTHIEVASDSMRVGKTTAVQTIAHGLRQKGLSVTESYEDWQSNPHLKASYENPAQSFLNSQKWFIERKWQQIKDAEVVDMFIQDVAPETDFCYAATNMLLGRMSEADFTDYLDFYRQLDWSQAPAPDLYVYLAVSDDELIRRAMDSRREFEDVEPEYFLMMKMVNRQWLAEAETRLPILVVETDHLDFSRDDQAKAKLVETVWERLAHPASPRDFL